MAITGFGLRRVTDHLAYEVRHAWRMVVQNPGFSAVALLSMALGIGANTAIFTFADAAFLKPLPYPGAERIVALRQRPRQDARLTDVHPRSFVRWVETARSFEALALAQAVPVNTEGPDGAEQVPGLWVSPQFLKVFGVQPWLGRDFPAEGRAQEVILSYEYWQRRYGSDSGVIGRAMPQGQGSAVIVGVMPAGFRVGRLKVDVYTPMQIEASRPEAVGSRSFLCFGRLRSGVTLEAAQTEMTVVAAQVARAEAGEKDFQAVVVGLRSFFTGENRPVLLLLWGVVALVHLIACANLASLLLTRGAGRRNELAVRAALGAGRGRIVAQLGAESLVLALLGGVLGLPIGLAGSRALAALSANVFDFGQMVEAGLDLRVFVFALLLSCLTALLFGLLPVWQASQVDLKSSVQAGSRGTLGGRRQERLRGLLVVGEVALAVVLLVGAGLLLRSFTKLMSVELGFRPENVVTMRTLVMGRPAARSQFVEAVLERVDALPGVQAAGTIQFLPLTGFTNRGAFHFVGRPLPVDPKSVESDVSTVSRGYFAAIGMTVLRGRGFERADRMESPRVAVVNRAFVERFSSDEDPIGRVILGDWADPKPTRIVGVVNDIRQTALTAEPRPTVFLAQSQVPGYFTNLVVRTRMEPAVAAANIRRLVREVDPKQPFTDVQPMEHYVATALARPQMYAGLVGAFASLAIFLAAIGLYGLLAHAVSQRRQEIGLRMALGARPGDILRATVGQSARLILAGVAVGSVASYELGAVVSKFLYDVRPGDPATYLGVGVVLGVAGLAATLAPALRAVSVDPMAALQHE
ncbi:MAG: ABC transporter permease [Paludibaculum sp.]